MEETLELDKAPELEKELEAARSRIAELEARLAAGKAPAPAAQAPAAPPGLLDLLYASNVREDWEGLEHLVSYAVKRKPQLLVLTNVLQNPLNEEERVAFHHANFYVSDAFKKDGNFSDIQLFVESFRHDSASDIVAVSARKILELIEGGKKQVAERLKRLAGILEPCPCPFYIVPGRFESPDAVREVGPPGLVDRYLTVRKVKENGVTILGLGGLPGLSDDCPAVFLDREYIEGFSQADEDLKELIGEDVDILVSFAPIKFFTDPGEEGTWREYISNHIPGRLVLTSQALKDYQNACLTASGAELIRGGSFGKSGTGPSRLFWEIAYTRGGLEDKSLFELKGKKAFRLL